MKPKPAKISSVKDPTIREYLTTPRGKLAMARAMMQPLRTRRDYEQCPWCGVTMILDPAVPHKHPDNECLYGTMSEVMDS